jgi:hypothetical protein
MASYSKVSLLFWKDREIRAWLRSSEHLTVMLFIYLLTCDHRNSEGLYWLPKSYVETDMALEADEVSERMAHLLDRGFVKYDEDAEVVFLPKALKYHEPKSKPQIKGAISALEQVPETVLFTDFLSAAETHAPTLAKEIRKVFRDRLGTDAR